MVSGNQFYFAWCGFGEAFNPAIHNRVDDNALRISVRHSEFGRRTAEVEFPAGFAEAQLSGKQACHISVNINGNIEHIFYGVLVNTPAGQRFRQTRAEFISVRPNDVVLQANLLAQVANDPILYIPQIEEAQDELDAETILKASLFQMEFDKDGTPYLCSMFGDPDRLTTISGSFITEQSFTPEFESIPPRGVLIDLELNAVDRWSGFVDCGQAIQNEINRIAALYGIPVNEGNFTFTPNTLNNWPKPGSTLFDSYVCTKSSLSLIDGPGTNPPTQTSLDPAIVEEPTDTLSGIPENPADYDANRSFVSIFPTRFSSPELEVFGIRSKKRKEIVRIYIPFQGQELIPGNAEPEYISLQASDLDVDETVEEWEPRFYEAGERVSVNGFVFECLVDHMGREGLLNDIYNYDPYSPTNGQILWEPVVMNNSPLMFPNTTKLALSAFGRRAIQYAIRRGISYLAKSCRVSTNPITVPVELAYNLDTGSTVRIVSPFIRGGQLEGKVSEIEILADAASGIAQANIVISSAIGSGSTDDEFEDPEDNGDGENGQEPGTEYPVASYGGDWDAVRYISPIYFASPLGSPEDEIKVRIDWLGCEQAFCLNNPFSQTVDPYSKTEPPQLRPVFFTGFEVDNEGNPIGSDDWLDKHSTNIDINIPSNDDDAKPLTVFVPVVFGWRGPKQIEV